MTTMKSHSLIWAALALTTTATMTSCLFEDDDKFDESAALRIEHFTDEVQELLSSADNGWVMEYFPNSASKGYTMLCRFTPEGTVTVASDHEYLRNNQAGKYTEATSLYELLKEDGPVLSFNTWNDVLTVFVDPVDPTTGEEDGYGLQGDHNFVILSASESEIRLRGERQNGELRMYPCTKDWQQFLADVKQTKADFFNSSISGFTFTTGQDTIYASGVTTGIMVLGERLIDPIVSYQEPFIVTDRGIRFQFAYNFNGVTAQEFVINADSSALVSTEGGVVFAPIWQNYVASHTDLWKLDTLSLNAEMKQAYDELAAAVTKAYSGWSLQYVAVGRETGSGALSYGMYIGVEIDKKSHTVRNAGVRLDAEWVGGNTVRYTAAADQYDGNMTTFAKRSSAILTATAQLENLLAGDYEVTPDHYFGPTSATFVSADGAKTLLFR
jgi:hypothetical protein